MGLNSSNLDLRCRSNLDLHSSRGLAFNNNHSLVCNNSNQHSILSNSNNKEALIKFFLSFSNLDLSSCFNKDNSFHQIPERVLQLQISKQKLLSSLCFLLYKAQTASRVVSFNN